MTRVLMEVLLSCSQLQILLLSTFVVPFSKLMRMWEAASHIEITHRAQPIQNLRSRLVRRVSSSRVHSFGGMAGGGNRLPACCSGPPTSQAGCLCHPQPPRASAWRFMVAMRAENGVEATHYTMHKKTDLCGSHLDPLPQGACFRLHGYGLAPLFRPTKIQVSLLQLRVRDSPGLTTGGLGARQG